MTAPALDICELSVTIGGRAVVKSLTLQIDAGETFGLVGESGSGKSITALAAIGLAPASAVISAIRLDAGGVNLLAATPHMLRRLRATRISTIFQEPMSALSPTRRIGAQMIDIIRLHQRSDRKSMMAAAEQLLADLEIRSPGDVLDSYPFQLSGGMRQRVLVAMAFIGSPRLVIADEITSAIDASLKATVLDLLQSRANEVGAAILLISHDLNAVRRICKRVGVMHQGELVEIGQTAAIIDSPRHSYTQRLIAALPELHRPRQPLLANFAGEAE